MEETNELQQMPEIQNIAEYLRNMKFRKKAFGGCDAESVLEHFAAVSQMYEAIICANKQQIDQYARQLASLQARGAAKEAEQAQQWYAQPAQQPAAPPAPVQQPYMDIQNQNPWTPGWAPDPWAQQAQPMPQQSYYPPQLVPPAQQQAQPYAWPEEQGSLPEPAYRYA